MSIKVKIALLLSLAVSGAVISQVLSYYYFVDTVDDVAIVNIAGRQRMLSQVLSSYAHMVHEGQDEDRQSLLSYAEEFKAALIALEFGGVAHGHRVQPVPEQVHNELNTVKKIWNNTEPLLIILAETPTGDPKSSEAFTSLVPLLEALSSSSDNVVTAMQIRDLSWKKKIRALIVISGAFGLALILISIGLLQRYNKERAKALRELRESEGRTRTIIESSADGVITINRQGLVTVYNPAAEKMFGYSATEMVGQPMEKLLPERFRKHHRQGIRTYFSTGASLGIIGSTIELAGLRRDGAEFPIELSLTVGGTGEDQFVLGTMRDITKRKATEGRLEQQRQLLRAVMDHNPSQVYLKDSRGRYIIVNKTLSDSLGLSVEDILSKTNSELSGKFRFSPDREAFERRVASEMRAIVISEESFTDHQGRSFRVQTELFPLVSPEDNSVQVLGFSTDITGIKRSVEESASAEKMASIGVLAGGVAHEFKNYLAGVIGNAEYLTDILGDRNITDEEREVIGDIMTAAEDANDIAMSLLTYSRRKPEDISVEQLSDLTDVTLKLVRRRIASENVELVTSYGTSGEVYVSASKIQQLILNLLSNALDAIDGRGTIVISITRENSDIVLRISDSGSGITAEEKKRVFEPFFSTKGVWGTSASAQNTGTGLGLSICRNIAEDHNGAIAVSSIRGVGTTFEVRLPMHVKNATPEEVDFKKIVGELGVIITLTHNNSLAEWYREESSSCGVSFVQVDSIHALPEVNLASSVMLIVDADLPGTSETVRAVDLGRELGWITVLINQTSSDAITATSASFRAYSRHSASLTEIIAALASPTGDSTLISSANKNISERVSWPGKPVDV